MTSPPGERVRDFYNRSPFPNYDLKRFASSDDLKAHASWFASVLDRSIPTDASILDVGTGTGQLAAFLSLRRKQVVGIDFSEGSLKKAAQLKEKLHLRSLTLKQIDILHEHHLKPFKKNFDYVLCFGVLHHTGDPRRGFANIASLVRPGGYLALGLYNRFGRIPHKIRRLLAKTFWKNNARRKDVLIRMGTGGERDAEQREGWWNDQYNHPHESTHTISEVLRWFADSEIEYYGMLPSRTMNDRASFASIGLWNEKQRPPSFLMRFFLQWWFLWKTHREGGYWIMFGRKRDDPS